MQPCIPIVSPCDKQMSRDKRRNFYFAFALRRKWRSYESNERASFRVTYATFILYLYLGV